jgi:catechol 2,3-dioxygenase-like lactoylglutathione lyase family enzyme
MKIEHLALNVPDASATAQWYAQHLKLVIKRQSDEEPWAHFLVDDSGFMMLELYTNRSVQIPDYADIPPANLHLAFASTDPTADARRLCSAGATMVVESEKAANGDSFAMVRDPWGLPVQFAQRAESLLG